MGQGGLIAGDWRAVLGVIAVVIGLFAYLPYYRDIVLGQTRPHPFSWLVWALLAGVAFGAQVDKGAGAGAWASGISALANFGICVGALWKGERGITRGDWAYFAAALLGFCLWVLAGDEFAAIIIVTVTNSLAFGPTFRKSLKKPKEETALSFALSAVKWALACAALESVSATTLLFPLTSFLFNAALAVLLFVLKAERQGRPTAP